AAIGAVLLVDGRAWTQLGGFDEASFMYAEDLDLFWRAHRLGWKAWFASEACFLHLKGTSSDLRWTARERGERIARAEGAMIRGHLPRLRAEWTLAFMRFGLLARILYFGLRGNRVAADSCRGSLHGLSDGRPATGPPRLRPAVEIVRPTESASVRVPGRA